ncbi:MAG: hypothetical protein ACI4TW_01515, partial [Prevotella sp.]
RTFTATESATLPVRLANQGGSFAFMSMVRIYTKMLLDKQKILQISRKAKKSETLNNCLKKENN